MTLAVAEALNPNKNKRPMAPGDNSFLRISYSNFISDLKEQNKNTTTTANLVS